MNETKEELIAKGKTCMNDYKFDDALTFFEQALKLNQDDPDVLNHIGVALRSLGRYQEAIKYFDRSLELDPRDMNSS